MENKKIKIFIPVFLAVAMILGIYIGNFLNRNSQINITGLGFKNDNKLNTIINLIEDRYVDSINTSSMIEDIIPDLLEELDPHSTYIPANNMQAERERMQGNFSGIGVEFSIQQDTVRIVNVISGGPSDKVGLLAGDKIILVNDSNIAGINIQNQDVMDLLRGEKESKVRIHIARSGYDDLFEFEIIRGDIPIYSVDVSYMVNDETGYIKISRFAERTYQEFMEAIYKLDNQGAEKLIIDLRENTGGYLSSVLQMVDEFLDKNELILYTEGLNQQRKTYYASARNSNKDKDVIVLIDEYSASASEIFAGALQDNDRCIVIGRRSFGKGLVQEEIPLSDGSAVRLTVARYFTPSGRSIQKPYDEGNDVYNMDLYERGIQGEYEVRDSIHLADSIKFYTKSGRIVYGGGGIMPDIFVPVDTSGYSEYMAKLLQRGIIYQFAYAYTDQNRELLNSLQDVKNIEAYLDSQNIFSELVNYASQKGIELIPSEINETSEFLIKIQLKAYIARNILGEEGFYPIIQNIDNTLLKAIEISKENLLVENLRN